MSHQITGVALAAVAAAAVDASIPAAAIVVGSAWLAPFCPAADRAGARLYRRTPIERRLPLLRPLGLLARLPLRVLIVLPHRGPTHSLFGCAIAAAVAGALDVAGRARVCVAGRRGPGDRLPRAHRGRR